MRILVTGAQGNLGTAVSSLLTAQGHEVFATDRAELDITDYASTVSTIGEAAPELVIHCAAMTQVDRCAEQPDEALRINAYGTQNVAVACHHARAALCYISTNEVFDSERNVPLLEYDVTNPANPYGYSKWMGEQMVRAGLPAHFIVRVSWLFAHGGSNFLQKIVQAAAAQRPISVVVDEVASPTYTVDVAEALSRLILTRRYGTYHLVNEGYCSRYDFARYILDCSGYASTPITPIQKAQWNRPSRAPTYSVLRNFLAAELSIRLRDWREAVIAFVAVEKLISG
jgi:dTDP-4-dehydrorhamnose reductase